MNEFKTIWSPYTQFAYYYCCYYITFSISLKFRCCCSLFLDCGCHNVTVLSLGFHWITKQNATTYTHTHTENRPNLKGTKNTNAMQHLDWGSWLQSSMSNIKCELYFSWHSVVHCKTNKWIIYRLFYFHKNANGMCSAIDSRTFVN